jgi:transposase-like protein
MTRRKRIAKKWYMNLKKRMIEVKIKKRKERRVFTAEEKSKAVLSIWSERRTVTEASKELGVCYAQLSKWQSLAMEGVLSALESKKDQEKTPALNLRLEKLLEKKSERRKSSFGKEEKRAESLIKSSMEAQAD